MKRSKLPSGKSKGNFNSGLKTNGKNMRSTPMRGGWRL